MTKLSVVIPCFNEKSSIETLLRRVRNSPIKGEIEIIVIDDFSTDGTRDLLLGKLNNLIDLLILQETNMGKGAAIRMGFNKCSGDIVLIQDADLEYNPLEYPRLLEPILRGEADVVFGSRFLGNGPRRVLYFWHRLGNGFLTLLSNTFTNLNLTDMETCYKVFTKEVAKRIRITENRFGLEPQITAQISRMSVRIYEVGISYRGRTYADGKKIGWKDGVRAIYCILKYNLFCK